jgi:hypothetical protein
MENHIPSSGLRVWHSAIQNSHLLRKMANSNPQIECCTLHTNAWLRATKFTPSLTGMLSACVACRMAGRRWGPAGRRGICTSRLAISFASRDRRIRYEPKSRLSRTYATPRSAVDVKVTGPLGLRGSRLDSGARCQRPVQA